MRLWPVVASAVAASAVSKVVASAGVTPSVDALTIVARSAGARLVGVGSVGAGSSAMGCPAEDTEAALPTTSIYGSEIYIQLPVISAVIIVVLVPSLVCRRSSVSSKDDDGVGKSVEPEDAEEIGPESKRPNAETIA